jgi:hypothetical protein
MPQPNHEHQMMSMYYRRKSSWLTLELTVILALLMLPGSLSLPDPTNPSRLATDDDDIARLRGGYFPSIQRNRGTSRELDLSRQEEAGMCGGV